MRNPQQFLIDPSLRGAKRTITCNRTNTCPMYKGALASCKRCKYNR